MKIPKECRIFDAATDEKNRFATNTVRFRKLDPIQNPDGGWEYPGELTATDGHIAVCLRVEDCAEDEDGLIPLHVLKTAHRNRNGGYDYRLDVRSDHYAIPGKNGEEIRVMREVIDPDTFPKVENVLTPVPEEGTRYAVNVKLLAFLAQAMGVEKVQLVITGEEDAAHVIPVPHYGERVRFALIMPVRVK